MKNEEIGVTTSAALPGVAAAAANGGGVTAQQCGCGCNADAAEDPTVVPDEEAEQNPPRPAVKPGSTRSSDVTPSLRSTRDRILPSCECEGAGPLVYALGEIGYDFGTEARRDSFLVAMNEEQVPGERAKSPYNPEDLLAFLRSENRAYKAFTPALIWTLNIDSTPVYALRPDGTFARETYETILEFYDEQIHKQSDRAAVPGTVKGSARLYSGQVVPVICPEVRGMANWATKRVVEAARVELERRKMVESTDEADLQLTNFLNRIYFELRNMGIAPHERALNYSATNAFSVGDIMMRRVSLAFQLDEDVRKFVGPALPKLALCHPIDGLLHSPLSF
jgi:cyanobactin maturation PatA/PatG family protease